MPRRISGDFAKRINDHLSTKQSNEHSSSHRRAKVSFFRAVLTADNTGKLSLVWLLNHLTDLPDNTRKQIVYKRGAAETLGNSFRLIQDLFAQLGFRLRADVALALFKGSKEVRHKLSQAIRAMPSQAYFNFPSNAKRKLVLEHEIKTHLAIEHSIEFEEALSERILQVPNEVATILEFVGEFSPRYVALLIEACFKIPDIDSSLSVYRNASESIKKCILNNNLPLSKALILQQPALFFDLTPLFQRSLLKQLLQQNDDPSRQCLADLKNFAYDCDNNIDIQGDDDLLICDSPMGAVSSEEKTKLFKTIYQNYQRQKAEAIYQQYLLEKACNLDDDVLIQGRFDIQGRYLCDVTLSEDDYGKILSLLQEQGIEVVKSAEQNKKNLSSTLGLDDITVTTACSIDVNDSPMLIEGFKQWIDDDALADDVLKLDSRCSLIALQTEMEMHIRLIERVMGKSLPAANLAENFWTTVHHRAALTIADEVKSRFKRFIAEFQDNGSVDDLATVNKFLDQQRPSLADYAKDCLIKACIDVDENFVLKFQQHVRDALSAHDFTSTTATGHDYLHSNSRSHTLIRISATNNTAHDKKIGSNGQALRLLFRNQYAKESDGFIVTPSQIIHSEARVPSIAIKTGSHKAAVNDVSEKLAASVSRLSCQSGEILSYHLLTSLNTKLGSFFLDKNNAQRASTARILKGAHQFNAQQLDAKGALVLVQNIPVNQHGNALSLMAFDSATSEACLMTELSLLHTLEAQRLQLPVVVGLAVSKLSTQVMRNYLTFLHKGQHGGRYFKDSDDGKRAIAVLQKQKKVIARLLPIVAGDEMDTFEQLLAKVLFKSFAHNQHCNKQFGMMIQSISIFLSNKSQSGCKSANERYQAVCGRVDLLHGMLREGELSTDEKGLQQALITYVNDNSAQLRDLQKAFDQAYSHHNLQASATHFSLEDQGGPSKLRASEHDDNGRISELNTNVGEPHDVDYLYAKYASPLQAHKGDPVQALISCVDNNQPQIQLSYHQ